MGEWESGLLEKWGCCLKGGDLKEKKMVENEGKKMSEMWLGGEFGDEGSRY
jgi:hypothetical protein